MIDYCYVSWWVTASAFKKQMTFALPHMQNKEGRDTNA